MTSKIPLLDLSNPFVAALVEKALREGSIPIDDLNSVLLHDEVDPASIEALLEWFSTNGVDITEW